MLLRTALLAWATENLRALPWRTTTDPYKICVAEVMLHQTSSAKVAPVYESFMARYPNPLSLSKAKLAKVEQVLHPLGLLYRATRLKEMAKAVVERHGGTMPRDRDELLALSGVGEYTTSAVLCFAYGQQVPIVDTNVIRVYARYFGLHRRLPSSSPNGLIRELAARVLPRGEARTYNYAILDFAAAVCSHYKPRCVTCIVSSQCRMFLTSQHAF